MNCEALNHWLLASATATSSNIGKIWPRIAKHTPLLTSLLFCKQGPAEENPLYWLPTKGKRGITLQNVHSERQRHHPPELFSFLPEIHTGCFNANSSVLKLTADGSLLSFLVAFSGVVGGVEFCFSLLCQSMERYEEADTMFATRSVVFGAFLLKLVFLRPLTNEWTIEPFICSGKT